MPGFLTGSVDELRTEMLSVVIPAYNEAGTIGSAVSRIASYCDRSGLSGEIIVVDDCSRDATLREAERAAHGQMELRILGHSANRGKGAAIRTGVRAARGGILLFTDADLSVPPEEFEKLRRRIKDGAQIAVGSRRVRGSPLWRYVPGRRQDMQPSSIKVHQPLYREALGEIYHRLVDVLLGVGVKDVNCGFKCFRSEVARALFELMTVDRWGFDAEILLMAQRRGLRVDEVDVDWYNGRSSKVNVLMAPFSSLRELLRIKMNDLMGRYTARAPELGERAGAAGPDNAESGDETCVPPRRTAQVR